jgi:MFS family permease
MLSDPAENGRMATIARSPCDEGAIRSNRCSQPAAVEGSWILAASILGSSMAFIDGTVVDVALPALQSALYAMLSDVQWGVESYALFLPALLLIGGVLGDLYGRRKVFAVGVALFSAASALCGCSPGYSVADGADQRQMFLRMTAAARSEPGPGSPP